MLHRRILYYLLLGGIFLLAPPVHAGSPTYSDIPQGHWAWPFVQQLNETGVLSPFGGDQFDGTQAVSRFEYLQSLYYLVNYIDANSGLVSAQVETSRQSLRFQEGLVNLTNSFSSLDAQTRLQGIRIEQLERALSKTQDLPTSDKTLSSANSVEGQQYQQRLAELESTVSELNRDIERKSEQLNRLYIIIALLGATSILK